MAFTESSYHTRLTGRRIVELLLVPCVLCLVAARGSAQTSAYTIGAQDVLTVTVWEHQDLSGRFSVEADGTISLPLIGRARIGGLTIQSAERSLEKLLADGYVKNPHVGIEVDQYRSHQVFVMGEVRQPGAIPFTGELTLLAALARAGGATERAGSEAVLVRPGDRADVSSPALPDTPGTSSRTMRIDLADLQRGGAGAAIDLRPGDTIFVSKAPTVFVSGEVSRPGEYPIRNETTLLQALALAGGVTDRGSAKRTRVVRVVNGRETEMDLKPNERVQAGDTIIVRERLF